MKTKDLLLELKKHTGKRLKTENDFVVLKNEWDSYRGSYDYMAIAYTSYDYMDYSDEDLYIKNVDSLIELIGGMEGKTVIGWKGGEFTTDFDLPIFISNYGICSGKIIESIEDNDTYINLKLSDFKYDWV